MSYIFDPWALEQMEHFGNDLGQKGGNLLSRGGIGLGMKHKTKNSRTVSFSTTCSVVLIPCLREYREAGINLWFMHEEFQCAKMEASAEIQNFMDANPSLTFEECVHLLHQPESVTMKSIMDRGSVGDDQGSVSSTSQASGVTSGNNSTEENLNSSSGEETPPSPRHGCGSLDETDLKKSKSNSNSNSDSERDSSDYKNSGGGGYYSPTGTDGSLGDRSEDEEGMPGQTSPHFTAMHDQSDCDHRKVHRISDELPHSGEGGAGAGHVEVGQCTVLPSDTSWKLLAGAQEGKEGVEGEDNEVEYKAQEEKQDSVESAGTAYHKRRDVDNIPAPITTNSIEIMLVTSNLHIAEMTSLFIQSKYKSYQWNTTIVQNAEQAMEELLSRHKVASDVAVHSSLQEEEQPQNERDEDEEKVKEEEEAGADVARHYYAEHSPSPGLLIAAGSPAHSLSCSFTSHRQGDSHSYDSSGRELSLARCKPLSPIVPFRPRMNEDGVNTADTGVPLPPPPGPFSPCPRTRQRASSEGSLSPVLSIDTNPPGVALSRSRAEPPDISPKRSNRSSRPAQSALTTAMLRAVHNAAERMAGPSYDTHEGIRAIATQASTRVGHVEVAHIDVRPRQFDMVLIDSLLGSDKAAHRMHKEAMKLQRAMTGVIPEAMSPSDDGIDSTPPPAHQVLSGQVTGAHCLLELIRNTFGEGSFPVAINNFEEEGGDEYSSSCYEAEYGSEPSLEMVYGATLAESSSESCSYTGGNGGKKKRSSHEDLARAIEEAVGLTEDTKAYESTDDPALEAERGTLHLKLCSGSEISRYQAKERCHDGLPNMPTLLARLQNPDPTAEPPTISIEAEQKCCPRPPEVPPVLKTNSSESLICDGTTSPFMQVGSSSNSRSSSTGPYAPDDVIDPRAGSRTRRYHEMLAQTEGVEDDDYQAWRDVTVTRSSYTTHHDHCEAGSHQVEGNNDGSVEGEDLGFDRVGSFCRDVDPEQQRMDYEEAATASGFRDVQPVVETRRPTPSF